MPSFSYRPARLFTVEQANACLPLVRSIVGDMVSLARNMVERRQRLEKITAGRDISRADVYTEELVQVEEELDRESERLQSFAQELVDLGIEPKGALDGLVDFPHRMGDRLVYLCWKFNEPEVLYWHEIDAGFAGRRRLAASVCAGHGFDDERIAE